MLRSRTSRWARLLALAAAGLGLIAAPLAASAAPVTRVDICHYDADLGVYKLIKVAPGAAVDYHIKNHPDGYPSGAVPNTQYTFNKTCVVGSVHTVNFDDVSLSPGTETGPLGSYADFSWTKTYVYRPNTPDPLGYTASSSPNIGFIAFPQDSAPLEVASNVGDVDFTSVFVTNPSGSATDPDGPITVTIEAWDDGSLAGTKQVVLADGASESVALAFDSVDTLKLSAGAKYFGIDDLTYFQPAS